MHAAKLVFDYSPGSRSVITYLLYWLNSLNVNTLSILLYHVNRHCRSYSLGIAADIRKFAAVLHLNIVERAGALVIVTWRRIWSSPAQLYLVAVDSSGRLRPTVNHGAIDAVHLVAVDRSWFRVSATEHHWSNVVFHSDHCRTPTCGTNRKSYSPQRLALNASICSDNVFSDQLIISAVVVRSERHHSVGAACNWLPGRWSG